jgi:murein L,D-transpeptidase YcbB/YkuD
VRVEYPVKLAQYLLKDDPRWQGPAIEQALAGGEQQTVTLKRPLPVHILYWTAWVDPDGNVQFRKDVYGHDAQLEKALAAEPPIRVDFNAGKGQQRADLAPADRRRG